MVYLSDVAGEKHEQHFPSVSATTRKIRVNKRRDAEGRICQQANQTLRGQKVDSLKLWIYCARRFATGDTGNSKNVLWNASYT